MTTDTGTVTSIERTGPLQGLGGMLGVEFRVWFPLRVALLIVVGLITMTVSGMSRNPVYMSVMRAPATAPRRTPTMAPTTPIHSPKLR